MKAQLAQWAEKLNQMSLRERILVLLVSSAVLIMALQFLLVDPLLKDRHTIKQTISQLSGNIQQQQNALTIVKAQLVAGINRDLIKRRDQLTQERLRLDKRIENSVLAMIPPKLMLQVLEDILSQNNDLTLLSLDDRPVVSILEQQSDATKPSHKKRKTPLLTKNKKQGLYKHTFVLRLQGSYPATIAYFEKLSALPWRFYWDDLLYQVTQYPQATITLEIHTVSMSEEWLGV
ncbi:MAG: hypothetical protein JKY66_05790 [Spongiibacteraceae bacterium]|nr:hypothetical protein [Spongiibacteraceae bacterium]